MKGRCDLCGGTASVACESDEARLCFECDGKVHSANFLVARHLRTLLCRCCGGPTPWRASGSMLGPAASLCACCKSAGDKRIKEEEEEEVDSGERDFMTEEEEEEEDEDDGDEDEESEGEEEEQVVPGTTDYSPPPPAVTESSSSRGEEEEGDDELATKRRRRENVANLLGSPSQDRLPCSSTFLTAGDDEVASHSFPSSKYRKKSGVLRSGVHHFSADHVSFGSGFPPT